MNEDIKTSKIEKQTFNVIDVECDMSEHNKINKIKFDTNVGKITLKPRIEKTEYQSGIKVKRKVLPSNVDELPDIIKRIGKVINAKGSCKIEGSYMLLVSVEDNVSKEFYYVTPGQISNWVHSDKIDDNINIETV